MLLKEKAVSTLSYLFSDTKICTVEMQRLYLLQTLNTYKISHGYFIIDDTMKHHTKIWKWIHGVFILFDHALGSNLKATCIVFLYYSDGEFIKFPMNAYPIAGECPMEVNFQCLADDPDGHIKTYSWDFDGDGVYDSNSPNPVPVSFPKFPDLVRRWP